MALSLAEGLREARNLPPFNGSSEYALTNYLRDVNIVLSLVSDENKPIIKSILANRLQGQALKAIQSLASPTWEQIIVKLREEFGVKQSFFSLRNDAMNINALTIEELHQKLDEILNLMNTKYSLNPEENSMFPPAINERIIFDIYLNFLSLNIKTLLIQNHISTIHCAFSYYLANNLLKDVYIRGSKNNLKKPSNFNRQKDNGNFPRNNSNTYQNDNSFQHNSNPHNRQKDNGQFPRNNSNPYQNGNGVQPNNSNSHQNSHNYRRNNFNQIRNNNSYPEPMELGHSNVCENFRTPPPGPSYH